MNRYRSRNRVPAENRATRVAAALSHANRNTGLLGNPRAYYLGADYEESVTADEFYDGEPVSDIDTGLVDSEGRPIYRVRETVSFGFVPVKGEK